MRSGDWLPHVEIDMTGMKSDVYECQQCKCHFMNTIGFKGVAVEEACLKWYKFAYGGTLEIVNQQDLLDAMRGLRVVARKERLQTMKYSKTAYSGPVMWTTGREVAVLILFSCSIQRMHSHIHRSCQC